jgi:hypothetical protein
MGYHSRLLVFCLTLTMAFSNVLLHTAYSAPAPQSSYSNITPTDLVGATNSGPTITATASGGNGRSTQSIASGNGGVRYTNTQPSSGVPIRAGLQFGTWDGTAADIDFRWKSYGTTVLADTTQTGGTVYTTTANIGDILEVRVVGTSVVWYINGAPVHTETTLTIGYPLKAAASIYASGDSVSTIQIDVGNTSPPPTRNYSNITPTNLVSATNSGSTITATATDGNGRSTESFSSGDGGVRYTNTQPSSGAPIRVGLQFGTWNGTASDIDFRWKTYGDTVLADTTQTGGTVYTTTANIGDILEVRVVGTSVVWYINEEPVHTEPNLTIGYPLKAAASIYASGDSASTIQIDVGNNLPLAAPSAVSVTGTTTSSVTFGWTNNGGSRVGTRVYRKQLGTNGLTLPDNGYTLIATPPSNATSYTNTGLSANENYIFKICSTDGTNDLCFPSSLNGTTAYAGTVNNYKTDHTSTTEPALKKLPLKGGKWFDEAYGTEIMRVTDDSDWPTYGLGTQYSIWPTFNCDNTYLLARQGANGGVYLIGWDATNFRRTTPEGYLLPSATPTGKGIVWEDAFWSTVNPNLLYVHDGDKSTTQEIWEYNVSTHAFTNGSTPLHTFSMLSGQSASLYLQQLSDDSDIFMYNFQQTATERAVVEYVVWKRSTNTILRQQNMAALGLEATDIEGNPMGGFNEVRIDKSGQYAWIILTVRQSNGQAGQRVQNIATGAITTFDQPPGQDHRFVLNHAHQGNGFAAGEDASTPGFQIRRFNNFSKYVDTFMFTEPDGTKFWLGGAHVTMSSTNDDWTTNSSYSVNSQVMPAFNQEIWQLANDGSGRVRRLLHHRSIFLDPSDYYTNGYLGNPKQTISRDGKFIAFTSNWGNSGRTDLFVAKINPAPTGLGITPRAQDTFNYYTAASSGVGTIIAGHTADMGGTWGLHPSYSASSPVGSDFPETSFAARGTGTGHALMLLNTAVPVSDYKVMTICHRIGIVGTGNMRCGAAARFSNPTNTGLIASWKESGFLKLDQYVNGTATELGSYALAVGDAKVHQITLQVSGTTVTVWVDGVARITATTSITGAGFAGFITGESTTEGVNGTYVRDFFVTSN